MTFQYPAVFRKRKDGTYEGYFPDLEGCEVTGETLDEVLGNARDAENDWITVEFEEDDPKFPHVSEPEDITLREGEFIRNISVIYYIMDGYG